MNFEIPADIQAELVRTRTLGRELFRPAGLEADRQGGPLATDHPLFRHMLALGFGRTSWRPDGQAPHKRSAVAHVLVSEELAYWDRGISIAMPGPGLGERPVLGMGTEEQKRRLLSPFLAPERPRWGAFAMTEPSGGSDVAAIRTRATKVDGGWVLNGAKAFSGNAERADWTVVWATVDPGQGRRGHRAFVIEKGTPGMEGFRTESKMGLRSYESISFFLNQCRVPDENLLGGADYYEKAAGFKGAMDTFNSGRPAVGAMAVGMGRAALDEALQLARASGAIALPRVADRLERMQRRLKSALLVALHAAWMADQRMPNVPQASMAKALGPAAALEAAQLAMEIAGPAAAAGGSVIEKIFRDIKAMDIVEGTGQVQRMVIARDLVQLPR